MKCHFPALLALAFAFVRAYPTLDTTSKSKQVSAVVIFGDSYTDEGLTQYRPGSNGEVGEPGTVLSTGGRVWPEYVNQYSGVKIYDYARSGAVCDSIFSPTSRNGVKQNQIPSFLADNEYVNSTGQRVLDNPSAETVYAIWIGTNDLGNGVFFTDSQPKGFPLTKYTDCVFEQLDRLYDIGARSFVVMNIAPLDLTPQYALPENGGVTNSRYWKDKSQFNSNLTQISETMREYSILVNAVYNYQIPYELKVADRYAKSQFALFDVHSLMSDIWNRPSVYLNGTVPLNVTGYAAGCSTSVCTSKSSWDSYMWYDELHPSEQTDRIIAREFVEVLKGRIDLVQLENSTLL
ncbi:putative GDSL-like lipase/acylhydrolase [Penicillium brasilianum]|uniref:Putative GDSL-like lipase/acylhydrolase n=1 Tax=Penicillium brasilianum TaxID=104259 RepID=A0A1S9RC03_PENBI|nr:putative GDSL-like lipase/acylhydrolase [Penicillium brasilianum]